MDGDLSDPGWNEAAVIETFYEFQPGDNTVPPVKTIARVGRDDKFFYASFWCEEPDVSKIRAPFVDRDGITDQQDYVGVLLDVDNSRRAAVDFWISPRGIQTDSILNESPFGEDNAPDYFWQSAGKIGTGSWTAEVAIPLSSLRYPNKDPQDWALMVYRVWPRDYNYQFYSVRMPRGSSCFLCWSATVENIAGLPQGMHYVVAPFAAGLSDKVYPGADGYAGDGVVTKGKVGVDVKWLPDAGTIVDGDDQPGLLAGRRRRRPDRRQRAVRALLPGEAAVLPRGGEPPADADPGDLHADDHQSALGRAADEPAGTELLHRARDRRPGRRAPSSFPGRSSRTPRRRTSSRTSASAASSTTSARSFVSVLGTARRRRGRRRTTTSSAATSSGGRTTPTS